LLQPPFGLREGRACGIDIRARRCDFLVAPDGRPGRPNLCFHFCHPRHIAIKVGTRHIQAGL
jgi:hypothetical protein